MPERSKEYDSFLIFDEGVTAGPDKVYGVLYSSKNRLPDKLFFEGFVNYLCGTKKWIETDCNKVDEDKDWIDKDGKVYNQASSFMREYSEQAFEENPIVYKYREKVGKISYNEEEDLSGSYIVSEELWNRLKEKLKG